MQRPKFTPYSVAIRSIFVLFAIGLVVLIYGSVTKHDQIARVGTALFISGLGVWGLTNGAAFAWAVREGLKQEGWGVFARQPWSSGLIAFLALFFLWIGVGSAWFIVFRIFG